MYYVRYTRCRPHIIFVNALLCKMQMLQIVTLHGDYQYQIAHFLHVIAECFARFSHSLGDRPRQSAYKIFGIELKF